MASTAGKPLELYSQKLQRMNPTALYALTPLSQ
jgi:hypothetical protein